MLYVGIVLGIVAIAYYAYSKCQSEKISEIDEEGGKITAFKIAVFLIGIIILAGIGGSRLSFFKMVGDIAFVLLIITLGFILFKKLFMR